MFLLFTTCAVAQHPDSVEVKVHPSYDKVSGIHRWFFGENYRKEWATNVKVPLIRISTIHGGLFPVKEGGGMQSKSLRLKDKTGKEWVIRSVEKTPDKLLPENLRGTFALDWVDDAMSAQHPFSALIVPPLASAAGVHHANPIIGMLAEDAALGTFNEAFKGMVVLLEEREPAGDSDNTTKMLEALKQDNDDHFDARQFLRARMLDLLLGDWDRHEDQWRWRDVKSGSGKVYEAVPRDRDQVFHVNQGLFPRIAALPWINPAFGNFDAELSRPKYVLFKTRFMNGYPDANLSLSEWMRLANEFVAAETDEVLKAGLSRLPKEVYALRFDELFEQLKKRRDRIPAAMASFYRFSNRIVDIKTSDKKELVKLTAVPGNGLRVEIQQLSKNGQPKDTLMNYTFSDTITKEIRLYLSDNDSLVNAAERSGIKLRIARKDSIGFVPVNLYNVWMPLATAAINADDGFLLGVGFKYIGKDGFRKGPYSNVQQLMLMRSFATAAFRVRYSGEWIKVLGKADFTLQAFAQAPDNTFNFFGLGNETTLNKNGTYQTFYRSRFDTYQVDPALRWLLGSNSSFSSGPSFQYYHLNKDGNEGRFINQVDAVSSYDGLTLDQDRMHLGVMMNFITEHRDHDVLPSKGYYLKISLQGYSGLNVYSKSYFQIKPEFTVYQNINKSRSFVLSNRIGGGVSGGNPAFYQSMFLGGQGNLLGYLQYRFAGRHMIYNNFQARLKLANIASYILPGQLGLTGFYDVGRVWSAAEQSDKWHQGKGGGVYFAPAGLTIFQILAGHSVEGWYPYVSLNFRL